MLQKILQYQFADTRRHRIHFFEDVKEIRVQRHHISHIESDQLAHIQKVYAPRCRWNLRCVRSGYPFSRRGRSRDNELKEDAEARGPLSFSEYVLRQFRVSLNMPTACACSVVARFEEP